MRLTGLLVLLLVTIPAVLSYNILGVAPIPARSHNILFQRLMISLAEAGHNVTFANGFALKKQVPNLKEIVLKFSIEDVMGNLKMDLFKMREQSYFQSMIFLPMFGLMMVNHQLKSKEFQELLNSGSQFDVILAEAFHTESILAGLAERFKAPIIAFQPAQPTGWVNYMVGNIAPTSFIPDMMTGYPTKMNFRQRFMNLIYQTVSSLHHHLYYLPKQATAYHKHFGNEATPMMDHIMNVSLIFTNDHHSLSYPRPLVPSIIPIGGVHVGPPNKLPQDLRKYLDNSKNGAILFSMGSNLKSSEMSKELIQVFLNVFSKLKQNVLWKFEKNLEGKPNNVMISDWLPQSDILAHPNLKLFITHGGLLSTTESMERGVPIIGIPIFGDQPMNMRQSVNLGVGLSLEFDDISEETLGNAINEILNNPKYTAATKARSRVLQDQPQTPLETAIFWIEYVARHKGAKHLRSAVLDLAWYEAYQLDVIAVLLLISAILLKITGVCLRFVCSKFCKSKKQKTSKKKKSN